jgi:hypothetical protein
MQNSLKTMRSKGKITDHPLKTAGKSTNFNQTAISFKLFFQKFKIEKD